LHNICIEFIDEDEQDDYWGLSLQLQNLTDIAFSPTLKNSVLEFYKAQEQ
jgi:hypothetical protein